MNKMKPCPFCAREPILSTWLNGTRYGVYCKCGCESPKDSKSKEGAIRIWNRRRYNNEKE